MNFKFAAGIFAMTFATSALAATPRVTVDELRRLQLAEPALVLLDVRDAKSYDAGHIQNSRRVASDQVLSAGIPQGATVVVYCDEDPCQLTTSAAEKLASYGYDVSILAGGFGAWLAKGYPAESSKTRHDAPQGHSGTTADVKLKQAEGATVLDLRPAAQYAAGHLPGARSAPLEDLDEALSWLVKEKEVVVYDVASARSKAAARKLTAAGFKVTELAGGVAGWVRKGNALVTN